MSLRRTFERIGKADASWIENARPLFWLFGVIGIIVGFGSALSAMLGHDSVYFGGRYLYGTEGALAGLLGGVFVVAIFAPVLATGFYAWGRIKLALLSLFRRSRS